MINVLTAVAYIIIAPILGGILAGIDRKITARMQGRVGPPILQPFYDVLKLFEKEKIVVTRSQNFYILCYVVFIVFTGALFFAGADVLLVIFALTLAHIFLILGAYSTNSPYSHVGAGRELLQLLAFEPMIIITAVGLYMTTKKTIPGGSFYVSDIISTGVPAIQYIPGIFLGYIYVLTIKLRKSPFDLSTSHHAHQEIVKGVTTEFSGSTLGRIEVAHWYETVFLLGVVYLFFAHNPILGVAAVVLTYLLEIFIDNNYPRVKWQMLVNSSWIIAALLLGMVNIAALHYFGGV